MIELLVTGVYQFQRRSVSDPAVCGRIQALSDCINRGKPDVYQAKPLGVFARSLTETAKSATELRLSSETLREAERTRGVSYSLRASCESGIEGSGRFLPFPSTKAGNICFNATQF